MTQHLNIKERQTMPVELVSREEYEEIKKFYRDVYHLLGSMNFNPNAKNVNELLKRAESFLERRKS